MLNSFKDSLHKVTDLTILFASIFTFLAFITPKEIATGPLERSKEEVSYNQLQLKELVEAYSENQDSINSIQRTINQLNTRITTLDPDRDIEVLQELKREIDLASTNLNRVNSQSNDLQQSISNLEASINAELIKIDNFESQLNDNKSISWIQPVRNNVESLANAAGMDGILAGFSALIFCLVCKRRKDWFKKIFRIFYK
tara:strand:- start:2894 stop:3493 length:600 start_codon:yes stop_codon:yes gene_type:complete